MHHAVPFLRTRDWRFVSQQRRICVLGGTGRNALRYVMREGGPRDRRGAGQRKVEVKGEKRFRSDRYGKGLRAAG